MAQGVSRQDPSGIGLPPRPFLYTIDQISTMTSIPEKQLHQFHVHHEGRDIGTRERDQMLARNIARPDQTPDWRVVDKEFIRWMRLKGFKFYDRGTITA